MHLPPPTSAAATSTAGKAATPLHAACISNTSKGYREPTALHLPANHEYSSHKKSKVTSLCSWISPGFLLCSVYRRYIRSNMSLSFALSSAFSSYFSPSFSTPLCSVVFQSFVRITRQVLFLQAVPQKLCVCVCECVQILAAWVLINKKFNQEPLVRFHVRLQHRAGWAVVHHFRYVWEDKEVLMTLVFL